MWVKWDCGNLGRVLLFERIVIVVLIVLYKCVGLMWLDVF